MRTTFVWSMARSAFASRAKRVRPRSSAMVVMTFSACTTPSG
jgi:hypothetical protein